MRQTIVLSLGGSIFYPKRFRTRYIEKLGELLAQYKNTRFVISCGGGYLARKRQLPHMTDTEKHYAGISAVNENAKRVRDILSSYIKIHNTIILKPLEIQKIRTHCIVGAEKPNRTTDYGATLAAVEIGAQKVINLSNIDYMYNKNPKKYKTAKLLKTLSWKEFFEIVGTKIVPGGNYPFDPISAKLAQKNGINVQICNGNSLSQIKKAIEGKEIGSIITTLK
jgi:uridylate kinase